MDRPTAYVGIDPASSASVCVRLPSGATFAGTVPDPLRTYETTLVREVLLAISSGVRVVTAIERPPAGLHGAAIPRWLGDRYEAMLRRAYARRVEILRPTPTQWQRASFGRVEKGESKLRSLELARTVVPEIANDDEADAVCLMLWARGQEGLASVAKEAA